METRMELFARIRRDARVEGCSIRQLPAATRLAGQRCGWRWRRRSRRREKFRCVVHRSSILDARAGSVPRRPYRRVRGNRRCPHPSHPLRQFDQCCAESDLRLLPSAGGEPAMGTVPLALRVRPVYCQPGISGAHEKGGVEGEVGRFRRNRLSPMPVVNSLDELNEKIRAWDTADNGRRINDRIRTVGQDFAVEAPLLLPVPKRGLRPGIVAGTTSRSVSVDHGANGEILCPSTFHRQTSASLVAGVGSGGLRRPGGDRSPSTGHRPGRSEPRSRPLPRSVAHQTRRPARASALAAARRNGTFTSSHDAFWAAARKTDGDAGGTRQLIDVLLLHRTIDSDDVIAGIEAALTVGAVTADVVAVEARRHASLEVDAGGSDSGRHLVARRSGREQRVVSLTQRRLAIRQRSIAGLPADSRPAPTVDHYDQLLRLPERRNPAQPAARAE